MNRVDTRDATTSRGAEGAGPARSAGLDATWSVVASVNEGTVEGRATSWRVIVMRGATWGVNYR